jgi:hypothetical protein
MEIKDSPRPKAQGNGSSQPCHINSRGELIAIAKVWQLKI